MNKIYKVVFNEVTGTWSAVAETAKSKGKKSKSSVVVVAAALALTAATPAMAESLSGGKASYDDSIAIMTGANAEGNLSVAIGTNAKTHGVRNEKGTINGQNVAIGAGSQAVNGGVSIGYEATSLKADGEPGVNGQSVAIGYSTKAHGDQSVAVGANTVSQGNSSVAIGGDDLDAVASTEKPAWNDTDITPDRAKELNNTTAAKKYNQITGDILVHYENVNANNKKSPDAPLRYVGTNAKEGGVAVGVQAAAGDLATAFGTRTVASGTASVSLGVGSTATDDGSFAAAAGAKSTGVSSVALGAASKALNNSAIAVGNEASATGLASTAIGQGAEASGESSEEQKDGAATAVGRRAKATGGSSTALGSEAEASAKNTVAIGAAAKATNADAVAVGLQAVASGEQAIALGRSSNVSGQHSGAFGRANNVANANTYVLGNSVTTTQDNSVVLGNASADRAATAETQATVGKITYSGFAGVGSPANGVVSVGRAGAGRQIINVAAGNVSAVSTDAINGSQLYATQGVINNVANSVANVLNRKDSNVDEDGNVTANFTVNGNKYNNVQEALENVDTDTVTVVKSEDKSVTVTKKADDKDGNTVYNVAVAKAKLKPDNDGTVNNTNPEGNENSFVTGDDVANAINNSGWKLAAEGVDGEKLIKPGNTATFKTGSNNLKVTRDGANISYDLAKDINISSVQFNNGPKITNEGDNIKVSNSTGGPTKITNVANGVGNNDAVNVSQLKASQTKVEGDKGVNITSKTDANTGATTYNVEAKVDGTTVTINDKNEIAAKTTTFAPTTDGTVGAPVDNGDSLVTANTVAEAINNSGWKLAAEGTGGEEIINPGDTATFKTGSDNLKVTRDGANISYDLAKDININSVQFNNGPKITNEGDNIKVSNSTGGPTKITNVANGVGNNDAVNVSQLKASRTTVKSSDNSISVVDTNKGAGDNFAYDIKVNNQAVVENAQLPVVYTNKEGDKVYLVTDADGNKTFNTKPDGSGDAVDNGDVIASMNNADGSTTAPTNLANVKGNLAPTYNTGDMTIGEDGKPTTTAAAEPTKSKEAPTPEDAAKMYNNAATVGDVLNAGWNIQGNGEAKDFVKPYDTVNFVNGQGTTAVVTTDAEGKKTDVTFNVNVDNKTTEYTYVTENGDTVYKHTDGNYYTQPNGEGNKVDTPVTTQVSAKTGTIQYNDGDDSNTNNTSAVDKGKVAPKAGDEDKVTTVQNVADAINASGFNLTTSASEGEVDGTTQELVNPGETVTIDAGKNIKVTQDGNKITVATKDQMVLGEKGADGKDGVDGSIGVNGKDGSGVVINGKDGSIGLKGTDGKDGLTLTPDAIVFNGVDGKDGKDGQVSMNFEKAAPALDGKDGQNGADGQTRIVYTKPNGTKEEVATMNDGLKFGANAGDNHEAKLNSLVDIKGADANTDWAKFDQGKNIMTKVESDEEGNGRITIGLAKDLKDIDSITVNNGPTINDKGINMNGDKITNVGAGTEDGDAVNVKQLKASRTTVKSSDNSISVVDTNNGKGDNFAYDIKVNNQAVVENAQLPVVYTNKEGDKVYLVTDADGNKTFNTKPDGSGDTVKNGDVIASMNNADGSTTAPTTLANVGGNLTPTYNVGDMTIDKDTGKPTETAAKGPTESQEAPKPADVAKMYNNAATVGDVLNAGWNIQGNGEAKDFVKPYDTVNFVNGQGTTAVVTTDAEGKKTDVTFNVNVDNKTTEYTYVTENGDTVYKHTDGNYYTQPNGEGNKVDTPVTTQVSAKTGTIQYNDGDDSNTNNTSAVDKGKVAPKAGDEDKVTTVQNVADAINASGFTLKTSAVEGGTKDASSTDEEVINPGKVVEMVAGKNLTVKQEANGKVTYSTKDKVEFTEVTAGDTVMDNKGITINKGAAGNPVTLTKDGLNNGGNRITNVAPGVDDTDAVNVSQLKASNANVHNRIDGVENNANAGVAQAMATAGLPQAYLPGKSMMAIGGGVYRGETGYAIGFSSISDGGNWIVKGTASGNSRGNYGATAAVGYQW